MGLESAKRPVVFGIDQLEIDQGMVFQYLIPFKLRMSLQSEAPCPRAIVTPGCGRPDIVEFCKESEAWRCWALGCFNCAMGKVCTCGNLEDYGTNPQHYTWVFNLQATDFNATLRVSGGTTQVDPSTSRMGVVVKDGKEWRDHCRLMHNGSWISSESLPCTVQKGMTHILHRGSNHFVLQLPGLLSLVGDCELLGDMDISNTHLVVFKHAGTWQIRMVSNDPASMLNLPYITSSRGKVQMALRVVQWGMARHNGIPALQRKFDEEDMVQHLAIF